MEKRDKDQGDCLKIISLKMFCPKEGFHLKGKPAKRRVFFNNLYGFFAE